MGEKRIKFAVNISRAISVYELTASQAFWIIYLFIYLDIPKKICFVSFLLQFLKFLYSNLHIIGHRSNFVTIYSKLQSRETERLR